jgi:sugar lactone lactonase YvrE
LFFIIALPTNIPFNARWKTNGITVAGGHQYGKALNQLRCPYGVFVDDDQTVFIADLGNHRIMKWKCGAKRGQVVAGGNEGGYRIDQLKEPSSVVIDKETNSLIICDFGNRRVMKWSCQNGTTSGETLIDNIACDEMTIDDSRFIYVSDNEKHEVRRYRMGETQGTVVAGVNGQGDRLNQFNCPTHIFVDRDYSVYVSDSLNHRVVKWLKDATEGIVVVGGRGEGNDLTQLSRPRGLFIDSLGTVYVADQGNHRVTRWYENGTQGDVIVGGNGQGAQANQLDSPVGLSFDCHGNLYVADFQNDRVQQFLIDIL